MKKKILLMLAVMAMLVCIFAISVSAAEYVPEFGEKTKISGMAEKSTFGYDGKFDTATSRVLMSDGVTYPAYYILADQTTMKLDFSELNNKTKNSYSRDSLIALELCNGITHVASCWNNNGFQGDKFTPNIEYIRVPSTLVDISTDAPFYSLTKLKVVDNFENTSVTVIPQRGFCNCPIEQIKFPSTLTSIAAGSLNAFSGVLDLSNTKLTSIPEWFINSNTAISGVILPDSIDTIGTSAFNNCTSLEFVKAGTGLTTVSAQAFYQCFALKTIDFSKSSIETIGLRSFFSCTALEVVNLGNIKKMETQSFYQAGIATDKDYVEFYIGSTFKEIYNQYGQIMQDAKTAVIYYTGTDTDTGFSALHSDALKSGAANWATVDAKGDVFDSDATYTANTIIYNYNLCDAFYDGAHNDDGNPCVINCDRCHTYGMEKENPAHNIVTSIKYTAFDKVGTKTVGCTNEGCTHGTTEEVPALFTCLGYSAPENGAGGIAIGFTVNNEAITEYEEITGTTVKYGVFAILKDRLGDKNIFAEDGALAEGAIAAEISNHQFALFELKIVGFEDDQKDIKLAMGAYVALTDGETTEYSYMQGGTPNEGEKYYFVSYNDIVKPSTDTDTPATDTGVTE